MRAIDLEANMRDQGTDEPQIAPNGAKVAVVALEEAAAAAAAAAAAEVAAAGRRLFFSCLSSWEMRIHSGSEVRGRYPLRVGRMIGKPSVGTTVASVLEKISL